MDEIMPPTAALASITPPSKQQLLLQGLKNSEEQVFARIVALNYGFRISNRWENTIKNIVDDIASEDSDYAKCTEDNLEQLVDRVLISANHHYMIDTFSQADGVKIRNALSVLAEQAPDNIYAKTYPALVDFGSNPDATVGHYLCKVVDMGDGYACIYATVEKEALPGHRAMASTMKITSQYFNTVFIPHKADRVELRISARAPARYHDKYFIAVRNEFTNAIGQHGAKFTGTLVNFFNCIESYFGDSTTGRIAHAILTTGQDSKDAELKNLRNKDYCARTQQVVDTKNNFDYICRAVLIRKLHTGKGADETDIYFFPHKNTWEEGNCFSVQIKKPQTSIALSSIITDAIARSKK